MNTAITIIINIKKMENKFKNANEVFKYYKWVIKDHSVEFDDTQELFNVGFELENKMNGNGTYLATTTLKH